MVWQIIVAIILMVISYLLTPKPKQPKPPAAKDGDDPSIDISKSVKVVFGTMTVKETQVLWFGNKSKRSSNVRA